MATEPFRTPLRLSGQHVELVPLSRSFAEPLVRAAQDPEIGRFLLKPPARSVPEMEAQIDELLRYQAEGSDLAFCQLLRTTHQPIGQTRYIRIDRLNLKVEIGGSWLEPTWWRTPVNTESKYLLLRHAFEEERFHRVVIQTDLRNERSQRAIARLGATREGVFRDDRLLPSGRFRSSVIYSVVADEWPRVKARLESFLARPWTPPPRAPAAQA